MPNPVILSAARASCAREGKSKDPVNLSSTMPLQGVLTIKEQIKKKLESFVSTKLLYH